MKKNFCLQCLFLTLSFFLISCQSRLETEIEAFNKECPVLVPGVGEITRAELSGANVMFNVSVDYGMLDFDACIENIDEFTDEFKSAVSVYDPDMQAMIDVLVEEEKGFGYRFVEEGTGKRFEVIFTYDEVKRL